MANSEWKYLQPEKFAIDLNAMSAEDERKFWHKALLTRRVKILYDVR